MKNNLTKSVTADGTTMPIQHPLKNQRGNIPIILGVLVLLLGISGGAYYLGVQKSTSTEKITKNTLNSTIIVPSPTVMISPTSVVTPTSNTDSKNGKQRIILKEEYYFDVTIPEGYSLKKGSGDYAGYVVDAKNRELIGFQKGSGGGEMSNTYPIVIDNVPLVIMYRRDIGCPADIFSKEYSVPLKMHFGIITWCTEEKDTQLPIYKDVIESIIFGPELRDVLLGKKPVPSLQYTP